MSMCSRRILQHRFSTLFCNRCHSSHFNREKSNALDVFSIQKNRSFERGVAVHVVWGKLPSIAHFYEMKIYDEDWPRFGFE